MSQFGEDVAFIFETVKGMPLRHPWSEREAGISPFPVSHPSKTHLNWNPPEMGKVTPCSILSFPHVLFLVVENSQCLSADVADKGSCSPRSPEP